MSQTVVTQTISTPVAVAVKEKKPRKPTLSGKLSKFLVSNYSLIQALSAKGLLSDDNVEAAYAEIKLLAPVEEQTEFYDAYLESSKDTAKVMKKFITQRNKPPKAPRKPRAKKEKKEEVQEAAKKEEVVEVQEAAKKEVKEKKPRKPRTKKVVEVVDDTERDLIGELVEAANKPLESANTVEKSSTKKAATKKADTKKADTKKAEEPKVEPTVEVSNEDDDDEEEEIHTQEFSVNGKDYLIDEDNNLYSIITHEQIGTFDPETKSVVAL